MNCLTDKHPLILIANFIFEYLAIHPFQDGNDRTSRLLTNLMMLQSEYSFSTLVSHEKITEETKAEYYLALNQTQRTWKSENEDITPWLEMYSQSSLADLKFRNVEAKSGFCILAKVSGAFSKLQFSRSIIYAVPYMLVFISYTHNTLNDRLCAVRGHYRPWAKGMRLFGNAGESTETHMRWYASLCPTSH